MSYELPPIVADIVNGNLALARLAIVESPSPALAALRTVLDLSIEMDGDLHAALDRVERILSR